MIPCQRYGQMGSICSPFVLVCVGQTLSEMQEGSDQDLLIDFMYKRNEDVDGKVIVQTRRLRGGVEN